MAAVKAAIERGGDVAFEMSRFAAQDLPLARVCEDAVRDSQACVVSVGFMYGTPVRDRPELSYVELEFNTATGCGLPRLVFLLDEMSDTLGIPRRPTPWTVIGATVRMSSVTAYSERRR